MNVEGKSHLTDRRMTTCLGIVALCMITAAVGHAAEIPDITLTPLVRGFDKPVHAVTRPDTARVLFVVEQAGRVLIADPDGGERHHLVLDLRDRVESGGEKGLLGLALHPAFIQNGRFFVNYTTKAGGRLETRISEFQFDPRSRRANPEAEKILLAFDQPYGNHNGGLVMFGPDRLLYIGVGDGGSGNDPQNHGQNLATLLGTILRIDVDRTEPGHAYAIPPDNPFVGRPDARPEIFAYGLRNPWRFSFDRTTKELFCGDVGQNAREEVDVIQRGGNYGWRPMEGFIPTRGINDDVDTNSFLPPIADYPRPDGVSITGGYVYRGKKFPALHGVYLYADFASGKVWGLRYNKGVVEGPRLVATSAPAIASFAEDADGELLAVSHNGTIYRIGL